MNYQVSSNTGNSVAHGKGFALASLLLGILGLLQLPLQLAGFQTGAGITLRQVALVSILSCLLVGAIGVFCGIISMVKAGRNLAAQAKRGLAVVGVLMNVLAILGSLALLFLSLFIMCGNCGQRPY